MGALNRSLIRGARGWSIRRERTPASASCETLAAVRDPPTGTRIVFAFSDPFFWLGDKNCRLPTSPELRLVLLELVTKPLCRAYYVS